MDRRSDKFLKGTKNSQRTYDVILRRVRLSTVAVEKQ